MTKKTEVKLDEIKLLILDIDGVLTDGNFHISDNGIENKSFNALDGHGIRLWKRAGLKVAFLSGRGSKAVELRAEQLDVDFVYLDCRRKMEAFETILKEAGLSAEQVCFIGDDLMDLPVMRRVAFPAAVSNAVDEVKERALYISKRSGGNGAVREVVEYILKDTGKWQKVIERYLE